MINSINNAPSHNNLHQASSTPAAAKKVESQPQAQASKSGALSQDQVTLKSTGNADNNGRNK
jgi:hypothetical protein